MQVEVDAGHGSRTQRQGDRFVQERGRTRGARPSRDVFRLLLKLAWGRTRGARPCQQLPSGLAAGPEAEPEALGSAQDIAKELVDVAGAGFVEFPAKAEAEAEGREGAEEEQAVAVEFPAGEVEAEIAAGIDGEAPEDGGEAEGEVADDGEEGEEMAAAHFGDEDHGEAGLVHVDEGVGEAHEELEQDHQDQPGMNHPAGQGQPAQEDQEPERQAEGQDRLAAEAVGARLEVGETGQTTEEREGGDEHDGAFRQPAFDSKVGDGESRHAAIGERPGHVEMEQFSKRWMGGDGAPGNSDFRGDFGFGRRHVGNAFQEVEADRTHHRAKGEDERELPRSRGLAEAGSGKEEGGATGDMDAGGIAGEVFAANGEGDEGGDPGEPGGAGNAAREIESEEQHEEQRQLGGGVEETAGEGNHGHAKDEEDAHAPPGIDEAFVADPGHVIGGRDLEDHEQGHHAGDDAEDGGAGLERFRVEDHGTAEHHLIGEGVERGKEEGIAKPGRESRAG
jgi:hypothetical protein